MILNFEMKEAIVIQESGIRGQASGFRPKVKTYFLPNL
jgi:hypothetical protein